MNKETAKKIGYKEQDGYNMCKCKKDERKRILKIIRDEIKQYKDYAKEYPQYWHPHNDALRFIAEEIEKDDKE